MSDQSVNIQINPPDQKTVQIQVNSSNQILQFASIGLFPTVGSVSSIYLAIDTGKLYRWTGSTYIEISQGAVTGDVNFNSISINGEPVISASGNATFNAINVNNGYATISSAGDISGKNLNIATISASGNATFNAINVNNSTLFNSNGSAYFASGLVHIDNHGGGWFSNGLYVQGGLWNAGSAFFDSIDIGFNNYHKPEYGFRTYLNNDGSAIFAGGNVVINNNGNTHFGNDAIEMHADGSAIFAGGNVVINSNGNLAGQSNPEYTDHNNFWILNTQGDLYTNGIWNGNNGGFRGYGNIFSYNGVNLFGFLDYDSDTIIYQTRLDHGSAHFCGYVDGDGNQNFACEIFSAGSARFAKGRLSVDNYGNITSSAGAAFSTNITIGGSNVVTTDDSRLSNARQPLTHKSTHATTGTDPLLPSDIGAASLAQSIAFAIALS